MSDQDVLTLTDDILSPAQKRRLLERDFLRIAVIGCGNIFGWRTHPSLYGMPVQLVALCDVDEPRARQYANAFGADRVYTDYAEMLAKEELDGVIVAPGSKHHPRIAVDVMEAGLSVLTEKPPATSAEGTAQMLDASRRTGQICMTAFQKRFAPIYRNARRQVESSGFGTPGLIAMNWYCPTWFTDEPENPNTWFLLDFGIHALDLCRYLFGDVADVYAMRSNKVTYAITLNFVNGAVGNLSLSGHRDARLIEHVELTGGPGQSVTIADSQAMARYDIGDVTAWQRNAFTTTDSLTDAGYRGEIAEFLAALEERREPESGIESAHQSMRLFDAILRSVTERRPVSLTEEK